MSKKFYLAAIFVITFSQQALCADSSSPYDVVAPSIYGTPSNPLQGQIFFDTSSNEFFGIDQAGVPVELSSPSGLNVLLSGGSGFRVESASVLPASGSSCTTSDLSTSGWIASTTPIATGECQLNFASGIFTSQAVCVLSQVTGALPSLAAINGFVTAPSTSGFSFYTGFYSSGGVTLQAYPTQIICMGK